MCLIRGLGDHDPAARGGLDGRRAFVEIKRARTGIHPGAHVTASIEFAPMGSRRAAIGRGMGAAPRIARWLCSDSPPS
jgi:hypothetical protein